MRSHPRKTRSNNTRPPIGVSTYNGGSSVSVSNPNAVLNDVAINECDALVSTSTLAEELKTRNVPRTTDRSGGITMVVTVNTLPYGVPVPCCPLVLSADDSAREVDTLEDGETGNAGGL